jgi:hypothetical protein
VRGGIPGDKVFENVLVVPHIDFNSNCGWLKMSKWGLTKLRRRKVKERIRILKSSDNNNTNKNSSNNDNDSYDSSDNKNSSDRNENCDNNHDRDNNDDDSIVYDDEYPKFIFHAAGCDRKEDALVYMMKKFSIDIDTAVISGQQQFKLKRDKLGRISKYHYCSDKSSNESSSENNHDRNDI